MFANPCIYSLLFAIMTASRDYLYTASLWSLCRAFDSTSEQSTNRSLPRSDQPRHAVRYRHAHSCSILDLARSLGRFNESTSDISDDTLEGVEAATLSSPDPGGGAQPPHSSVFLRSARMGEWWLRRTVLKAQPESLGIVVYSVIISKASPGMRPRR
ncbi:hypothetical protein C8T65DRAFT_653671 [Cerioporus squamosus]|nr:hypothetical protein C8T65DRAFT_653671 [Cerioporus squamosus]